MTMQNRPQQLEEEFNKEALMSLRTLATVRDLAQKDGDRIKAAEGILNRSTDAPRIERHKEGLTQNLIVQLPVKVIENVKTALKEVGRGEVVDLLERRMIEERGMGIMTPEEFEER